MSALNTVDLWSVCCDFDDWLVLPFGLTFFLASCSRHMLLLRRTYNESLEGCVRPINVSEKQFTDLEYTVRDALFGCSF